MRDNEKVYFMGMRTALTCRIKERKVCHKEMPAIINGLAEGAYVYGIDRNFNAMNNECENVSLIRAVANGQKILKPTLHTLNLYVVWKCSFAKVISCTSSNVPRYL